VIDVVCGMAVSKDSEHRAQHGGQDFYFCSEGCRKKFIADPEHYVDASGQKRDATHDKHAAHQHGAPTRTKPAPKREIPAGTIYTCPMHPEIRQVGPGSCPICGMALEPRTAGTIDGPDPELVDMTRRFWIGLVLTLPLLAFVMGDMLPGQPLRHLVPGRFSAWLQLVLATPVVLWAGWPFFERGWASIVNRSLNMFTLIALGTGMAYLYSVVGALAPGLFPASFRTHGSEVGLYFEAAAVITVLV
jgi:Cu+-exporting ATPase